MKKHFLFGLLFLACSLNLIAQNDGSAYYNSEAAYYNLDDNKLAVQGYDLVAYQLENKAIKGSPEYQAKHHDATYYFISAENKTSFLKDPESYLPAYGGYCAYGVGMSRDGGGNLPGKYPVNPEAFKIVEGKLCLFYDAEDFKALPYWNAAEVQLLESANKQWQLMNKL